MDETTLPDFGEIREALRRFNRELSVVDVGPEEDDSSRVSLRWEDGQIVGVPKENDDSDEIHG